MSLRGRATVPAMRTSMASFLSCLLLMPLAACGSAATVPLELSARGTGQARYRVTTSSGQEVISEVGRSASSASSGTGAFDLGAQVSIELTPSPATRFVGWDGDCKGMGNPASFVLSGPTRCIVVLAQ
jgi:hypothetical protein